MFEENFRESLHNAFLYGDSSNILDFITSDSACKDILEVLLKEIANSIKVYSDELPDKEEVLRNILQILADVHQVVSLSFESCCFLSQPILLLVAQEDCSLVVTKRIVQIFNAFLENTSFAEWVCNEDSLESSIQILGRKIPLIGDFECQALIFEALCRITSFSKKEYWSTIWFQNEKIRSLFESLNFDQFELECRKILNLINRNEDNKRIYSFVATSVYVSSFELRKPHGCDFWIDFNYDSRSLSFYCSDISTDESSASWETVLIFSENVLKFEVIAQNGKKVLFLTLNCPVKDVITSNIACPAFETNILNIKFWSFLDIDCHLKAIFGNQEIDIHSMSQLKSPKERKISTSSEIIFPTNSKDKNSCYKTQVNQSVRKSSVTSIPINHKESDYFPEFERSAPAEKLLENSKTLFESEKKASSAILELSDIENGRHSNVFRKNSNGKLSVNRKSSISLVNVEFEELFAGEYIENPTDQHPTSQHPTDSTNQNCIVAENGISENGLNTLIIDNSKYTSGDNVIASEEQIPLIPLNNKDNSRYKNHAETIQNSCEDDNIAHDILLNGKSNETDKISISSKKTSSTKGKSNGSIDVHQEKNVRKAAKKAMNLNKTLLQEELEKSLPSQKLTDNNLILNHEKKEEDDFQPIKKRRHHKRSIFLTDTETGSSDVSWFVKKRSGLFESPRRSYATKKRKSHILSSRKTTKKQFSKNSKGLKQLKELTKIKSSDSGSKSKSCISGSGKTKSEMSTLNSFQLIIEKDGIGHNPSNSNKGFQYLQNVDNKVYSPILENFLESKKSEDHIENVISCLNDKNTNLSPNGEDSNFQIYDNDSRNHVLQNVENSEEMLVDKFDKGILNCDTICDSGHQKYPRSPFKDDPYDINVSQFNNKTSPNHYEPIQNMELLKTEKSSSKTMISNGHHSKMENATSGNYSTPKCVETCSSKIEPLSLKNLNLLQDEAKGKRIHMKRYLESLTDSCSPPKDMEVTSNFHDELSQKFSYDKGSLVQTSQKKFLLNLSSPLEFSFQNMPGRHPDLPFVHPILASNSKLESNHSHLQKNNLKPNNKIFSKKEKKKISAHLPSSKQKPRMKTTHHSIQKRNSMSDLIQNIMDASKKPASSQFTTNSTSTKNSKYIKHSDVFHILANEVKSLTRKLFATIQKYSYEYSYKVSVFRDHIVTTAEALISNDLKMNETDIEDLIKQCKMHRLHIKKSLKKITTARQEYLEAEKQYEKKIQHLNKKLIEKFTSSVQLAGKHMIYAVEQRILAKARVLLKKLWKEVIFT